MSTPPSRHLEPILTSPLVGGRAQLRCVFMVILDSAIEVTNETEPMSQRRSTSEERK
jgi:hypothetical protein